MTVNKIIRWQGTVVYRTKMGSVDVTYDLEELVDIHDLVEAGPHWDTVEVIEVRRVNHSTSPTLTVEEVNQCCSDYGQDDD